MYIRITGKKLESWQVIKKMVTKRQVRSLRRKIKEDPVERMKRINEVEIYLDNEDGTLQTPEGEIITEEEYCRRLEEERKIEEVIEMELGKELR